MKAHIVGGGFGGLAAAALLIRNADVPGVDITVYEAADAGHAQSTCRAGYRRRFLHLSC
jgi:2-polyprenyl-6-methoxyphenol hydroxylase-like FAD-dependent oxidoreductase